MERAPTVRVAVGGDYGAHSKSGQAVVRLPAPSGA